MPLGRFVGLVFATIVIAILIVTGGASTTEAATMASILPPLVAIGMAFLIRQVIVSLFIGLWLGGWMINGFDGMGLLTSFMDTTQIYVLSAVTDADHQAIIIFSMLIAGMVGIISKNGGMKGIVNALSGWITNRERAQKGTMFMGLGIFFDDYANTLVVGNTMRPVTDRLKISREKLAYIVDSTAAPVACIALISTWVGFEIGLIDDATKNLEGFSEAPYFIFLNTILYSFYPILALVFVYMVAHTGRDFGPMLTAERKAIAGGEMASAGGAIIDDDAEPSSAFYAVVPILILVVTVIAGIFLTGEGDTVREVVGSSDSYKSLIWGSLLGVFSAIVLTLFQGRMSLEEILEGCIKGMASVVGPFIILILSWSLAEVTGILGTANYMVATLGDQLPMTILPALTFIVAAITAFGTGSSWGVMGILLPLVVPLVWAITGGDPTHMHIVYSSIACVLTGAIWGDHCSPISDTTILSSLASDCNHVEHVRTQMPYALLVGAVTVVFGALPVGFGLPWWAGIVLGAVVLWFTLKRIGTKAEE
jgi:Na+/H+ antiporter NhaC